MGEGEGKTSPLFASKIFLLILKLRSFVFTFGRPPPRQPLSTQDIWKGDPPTHASKHRALSLCPFVQTPPPARQNPPPTISPYHTLGVSTRRPPSNIPCLWRVAPLQRPYIPREQVPSALRRPRRGNASSHPAKYADGRNNSLSLLPSPPRAHLFHRRLTPHAPRDPSLHSRDGHHVGTSRKTQLDDFSDHQSFALPFPPPGLTMATVLKRHRCANQAQAPDTPGGKSSVKRRAAAVPTEAM